MTLVIRTTGLLAALLIAACNGNYSGTATDSMGDANTDGNTAANSEAFFQERVQPRLGFCRSCHVPGGIADVVDGRQFMLSSNRLEDLANLQTSWARLGGNNPVSRILTMASGTDSRSHSGGNPWPSGSDAYNDVATMLACFANPGGCLGNAGSGTVSDLPLLGSARGGHRWFSFCEGKADDAQLPPDPRSLVQPGVNAGKAVYFNAYWKDCHIDPARVGERPHPKTCGELRTSLARGAILMEGNGVLGQASTFAGQEPNGYVAMTADAFNNQWQVWGLSARPDNFDELLAERQGLGPATARNPYPLPGENPNATNGGSGQLPRGYLQTRNADGSWSGNITTNCQVCHTATIGDVSIYGSGGSQLDAAVGGRDAWLSGGAPAGIAIDRLLGGRTRGTNVAQFDNIAALGGVADGNPPTPDFLQILLSGATGSSDTPAWWNIGHRPIKFVDAQFPGDAVRADFALFNPLLDKRPFPSQPADSNAWISTHVQDGDHWMMSLRSPEYPLPVDTALAEQGAVLFHSKNLWAPQLNNPLPKPAGGNGSCASCHGAYSPRYVNDSAYLDTTALEGIASYLVPLELIGTDPVRATVYGDATNDYLSRTFFAYPETADTAQDCRVQHLPALRGNRPRFGYAAPPLYGVWATAPYFHNGSVPNVWEVLRPTDRQPIWRRLSRPARADQVGLVVMGFDSDLGRAFDQSKLGWKYDALACGAGTLPYLDCDPSDPNASPAAQALLGILYGSFLLGWNVATPPAFTLEQIEERKIYNTRIWSQGNQGHAFTAVLTDQEMRAVIEYLKTL